ncbi:AAA family ATPase [Mycoplasma sp. 888]|uniref:AAA family ATPase n=1 Tax=Mycoplasma sp. 888 TaxID=3108483 RepID=UPI002D77AEF8|nr:AAA family ATPase [Mycoplasma sp. 888]WRQ25771.1 AAA family ATPase [Mycoplasma sp. 888]
MSLKSSLYESLKYKINSKNIIIFKGNVDETIFPKILGIDFPKSKKNFLDSEAISFKEYIALYLYQNGYDNIHYFSSNLNKFIIEEGIFKPINDVDKNWENSNQQNQNEFILGGDDDFPDYNENFDEGNAQTENVHSLNRFIEKIENTIEKLIIDTQNNNLGKLNHAYIIDLSEFIISERNTQLNLDDISRLINLFTSFFNSRIINILTRKLKLIFIVKNDEIFSSILLNKSSEILTHIIEFPDRKEREVFINKIQSSYGLISDNPERTMEDINYAISITDGFSIREILQFAKVKNQLSDDDSKNVDSFKSLYRLVKFHKKDSEWEKMDFNKIENLEAFFSNRIKGQNRAIRKVKETIIRSFLGLQGIQQNNDSYSLKPRGVLFLVGPTGVGKTELAKTLSEFVFGDEKKIIRFDMSEYNHEESDQKLIGAPPGYIGYEAGGKLINEVISKPFSILLFDEIEKANGKILDKFLQILEDGCLTSSKGELADFSETFIIFTSNLGASNVDPNFSEEEVYKHFKNAVTDYFVNKLNRPEILNRIGIKNIVPFNLIKDKEIIKSICQSKLEIISRNLQKQKSIILKSKDQEDMDNLIEFILNNSDKTMGARGLVNTIETIFIDRLSSFMFANWNDNLSKANKDNLKYIRYSVKNNKLIFEIH